MDTPYHSAAQPNDYRQGLPTYEEDAAQHEHDLISFEDSPESTRSSMESGSRDEERRGVPPFIPPKRTFSTPVTHSQEGRSGRQRSSSTTEDRGFGHVRSKPKYAILVMGATGAGKSSFIAAASGLKVNVGHSLDPCTSKPQEFDMLCQNGAAVSLIDTPGFNDLHKTDMDVLQSILDYVTKVLKRQKIIAVLYLHRIVDKKITGSSVINLRMLRAICGEHFFQNIGIVTSMWAAIPRDGSEAASNREVELNTEFWGDMAKMGAVYRRWGEGMGTHFFSAREIVQQWTERAESRLSTVNLQIILELDKGVVTEDTSAGQILTEELRKRQEKERKALQEEEEERKQLEEEARQLQFRMKRAQDGIKKEADLAGSRYRRHDRPFGRLHDAMPEAWVRRERKSSEEPDHASDRDERRPARRPDRSASQYDYEDADRYRRPHRGERSERQSGRSSGWRFGF